MTPQAQKSANRYASIPGVDPYIDWILGPGRPYYFRPGRQQTWISIVLRLAGNVAPQDFARGRGLIKSIARRRKYPGTIHIPEFYSRQSQRAGETLCTAFVTEEFFKTLRQERGLQQAARRITLGLPLDADSLPVALRKRIRKGRS